MAAALILSVTAISAQYNKEYFLWMGRQNLIQGDYREAINSLNMLIRFDKNAYEGYFLRGIAKYNMGDTMGADADLSQALTINPVYTMAYNYRAITRSQLGNYDDALKDFAAAIELRPDLPDPYYSRGVTRLLNQQFELAIKDFDHFITQEKRFAGAYINRGICNLQLRDTTEAYRDFEMAIRTNRNDPEGYNRRGTLYLQQKRYAEAITDFDNAIHNDSTHIPSYFNRALALNDSYRPNDALLDLDKVIELDPTSSITYFNRAILLSRVGDYNMAIEDYDQVAELSPENVLVYFYRANLLTRLGEIELAEEDYTRSIELYPDFANAYLSRSNIRFLLRDTDGALKDKQIAESKMNEHKSKLRDSNYSIYTDSTYNFDRLLSCDTKLAGSRFDNGASGSIGAEQDEELRLISQFRFTLIRGSNEIPSHRAYYDQRMEEFIASIGDANLTIDHRATNIESDSLSMREEREERATIVSGEWSDHFRLGITQSLIKQYTSSISSLNKAIERNPDSPFLYINRAATRAEMIEFISSIESSFHRISIDTDPANRLKNSTSKRSYDYDESIADLERAIALHPDLIYSHYNIASLYVLSGRLPEAYEAYSRAIELYPAFAEAYYNRGIVQIMLKDTNKGCLDLSKAGELGVDRAYKLLERYTRR
ncbi:MAG: tetratricopeptide repeat protein [Rikenellaceae bacterium]